MCIQCFIQKIKKLQNGFKYINKNSILNFNFKKMSYSQQYHDPIYHDQVDFNDSIILRPISLKPSVRPSLLNRSNPQNTILGAYDTIKLTQYSDHTQDAHVVQLINLQPNSLIATLTQEGIQFLQRFSSQDIAFVTISGQKSSGKSFFLDKILNLSNVQGNNFSIQQTKPSIKIWSSPFVKQELRFFIAQICNCSPGSKQFDCLLPYATIISSIIINLQSFKQNKLQYNPSSISKLDQKFNLFQNIFHSANDDQTSLKNQLLNNIYPSVVYSLKRNLQKQNQFQNQMAQSQIRIKQVYLPNAKHQNYGGIDQDLRIHSFLNKKCIQQGYIKKVSQIFKQIINEIHQKKHRHLVFNGGILLKYIRYLSVYFSKRKPIDIQNVYKDIVRELYISAYNYCVICYHQALQQFLSNEKPRSLDQLLAIFQQASNQILQKYNQFSLDKQLHQQYEQKLLVHINSKQKLILQINKKKTDLQLTRIYQQHIDMNNLKDLWKQINKINKQNSTYTHGRDETIGRKLAEIILKLKSGNNVDYRVMKEKQRLQQVLKLRRIQLNQVLQGQQAKSAQINQNRKKKQQIDGQIKNLDQRLNKLKRQIHMYQNIDDLNPAQLKDQQNKLTQKVSRNQKIIEQLKSQSNEPLQNNNNHIKETIKKIQYDKNKIQLIQNTLKQLLAQKNNQQNVQKKAGESPIKDMNIKRESSSLQQKDPKSVKKPTADNKAKEALKNSKKPVK